jgi:outer membrane protein insertion porin family
MRFSPVFLAVLTASVTVGFSVPVRAQSEAIAPENPVRASEAVANDPPVDGLSSAQSLAIVSPASTPSDQLGHLDQLVDQRRDGSSVSQLEQNPPEFSQAPAESPSPSLRFSVPTLVPENGQPSQSPSEPQPQNPIAPSPASPSPSPALPSPSLAPRTLFDPTTPGTPTPPPETPGTPTPAPTTPGTPTPGTPTPAPTSEQEPRVLVAEVVVTGAGDLENQVYQVIKTRPGRTTTRSLLQEDINAIFATGFFANVRAVPEDTPLGVRVTFVVQPNPVLRQVQIQGNQVLPQTIVDSIFSSQYGSIIDLNQFQKGIESVNQWYKDNGYVLAQVVGSPRVAADGTVTLNVAEGVIETIQVRFLNKAGEATDEQGNPIQGRTREFIITREFESKPGDVFNQEQIQADLQRVFGLGIFDDVRVSLNPGQDPRKVNVVVNVTERSTGSLTAGGGVSSASGLFGTASYQQQNLGGNNQQLGAEIQFGQRDLLFNLSFTDPWIATDPYRTSYTVNLFSRRSISLIFDGGDPKVDLPNGDRPVVSRLGGGVTFSRPLDRWLGLEGWRASAGIQYQRVSIRQDGGELSPLDELGNNLSFSGRGIDDLLTLQIAAVSDRRNDANNPTSGSVTRISDEQSIPVGVGSILLNRIRASYSFYIPVRLTTFNPGPQALAFNLQAGTVLGDLPPYEAFSLGGTDSVRGYDAGELASGRTFVQGTVEYRFPVFSVIGAVLFADFGTDLGSGSDVPGQPAEIRGKPGSGFGVGVGVRVQSPLGPIRIDYAVNDQGASQIHFGIGQRF